MNRFLSLLENNWIPLRLLPRCKTESTYGRLHNTKIEPFPYSKPPFYLKWKRFCRWRAKLTIRTRQENTKNFGSVTVIYLPETYLIISYLCCLSWWHHMTTNCLSDHYVVQSNGTSEKSNDGSLSIDITHEPVKVAKIRMLFIDIYVKMTAIS